VQPDSGRELIQTGSRRGGQVPSGYQASQHGDIPAVPHNEYPTDGMTMFCRTGPPSERSSATSANRPSSRGSQSECSNPTSFSSQEPPSGKQSPIKPTKPTNGVAMPGMEANNNDNNKQVQKKRSAFFSNSPFRRKSKHDKDRQTAPVIAPASRNTWGSSSKQISPVKPTYEKQTRFGNNRPSASPEPEPVDPRANFQLNVGNNVFDVASPDTNSKGAPQPSQGDQDLDPIARALADLKGVGKQSSVRMSADRYHGIATPAPSATPSAQGSSGPAANGAVAAAQRGTPPPAYNDASVKRLDAPQPAFTSAQMQKTTQKYVGQKQDMFSNRNTPTRPTTRAGTSNGNVPRAVSPAARRSASPQPAPRPDTRGSQYSRGNPSPSSYHSSSMNSRHRQSPSATPTSRGNDQGYQPQQYSRHNSPNDVHRAASPQPQFARQDRPSSAGGMELQLSNGPTDNYGGGYADSIYEGSQRGRGGQRGGGRPMSMYYGGSGDGSMGPESRVRSKSVVIADTGRQFSRDGRPILHYGKSSTPMFSVLTLDTNLLSSFHSTGGVQLHSSHPRRAGFHERRRISCLANAG
jgi:hypothetical protein